MLNRCKTSTQISIKFTLFTILLVLFFGIVVNIIFFQSRSIATAKRLQLTTAEQVRKQKILGRERHGSIETFPLRSPEADLLFDHTFFGNISHIEDQYFMVMVKKNKVRILSVTKPMELQRMLVRISIILLFCFGIGSYFLSLIFVKTSLRSLQDLVQYAKNIHLDNLTTPLMIQGPPNDEIKILSEVLFTSLQKIHHHTLSLKDFISHASHELKTPLMAMNTEIDYIVRAKDYDALPQLKQYIATMDRLFEQLLLITTIENTGHLPKSFVNLVPILQDVCALLAKKYSDKVLTVQIDYVDTLTLDAHGPSFEMILQNLLDNAYKYTPEDGTIALALDATSLTVTNSGDGIADHHQAHIRDRFWQADPAKSDTKSFGLGLYLVKKLVQAQGWTISLDSSDEQGTVFRVMFG